MAYEDKTPELLHQSMLENVDDAIDKREGSITHDLTYPAAIEISNSYVELDTVLGLGFADTSEGIYLDYICSPFGVTRKPSIKAIGEVTLTGTPGTIVPINTRLQTTIGESVFFVTKDEITLLNDPVKVAVEAEEGGISGNVAPGEINALAPGDLYGIVNVINELSLSGGVDEESDESLLKRLKYKGQNPATSGNANHYKQWALEVSGVKDAKVFPVWNGGNTVKVVLLGEDNKAPSETIVNNTIDYISKNKPIGAIVTIVAVGEFPINISATLTLVNGKTIEEAKTEFSDLLSEYLSSLAFKDTTIRYQKIASLLIDVPSIVDFANLTVNEGTANITIKEEEVATLGTVVFS